MPEYGLVLGGGGARGLAHVGVWRVLREFESRGLPLTIFGVGMAMKRYPELVQHFVQAGYEIANHGLRWIHYQNLPAETEARHIALGTQVLAETLYELAV